MLSIRQAYAKRMPDQSRVLELAHLAPIAVGHQRAVYQHPHAPDLLIKVMRPEAVRARRTSRRHWFKRLRRAREYISYVRETKEYIVAHTREGADPPLARIAGLVETDLGLGLVCEKVCGPDGAMAPTLLHCYLDQGGAPAWADAALEEFRDALLRNNVIVGDLNAANLVYGSDSRGGPRLVMVDGFGDKNGIPLCSMSRRYNRQFIRRRYRRMRRELAAPPPEWTEPSTQP